MKKIITLFCFTLFWISSGYAQEFQQKGEPNIKFEKKEHDFGKVQAGTKPSYEFKVTNTGDAPLLIKNVKPSCGCTTPEWPKSPIKPGEEAAIKAVFDAKSPGSFNKSIRVVTNVPFASEKTLRIKGKVVKSEQ